METAVHRSTLQKAKFLNKHVDYNWAFDVKTITSLTKIQMSVTCNMTMVEYLTI